MRRGVDPSFNILDLPAGIYQAVVEDIEHSLRDLIACADDTKYELSGRELERCLRENGSPRPVEQVLQVWSRREMTVHELAQALRMLKLEQPLRLLIEPEKLRLKLDLKKEVEVDEGEVLLLECEAVGFPFPKYSWLKDDGRVPIVTNRTGRLEITQVGLNNTGDYICRIHNVEKDVLFTHWCKVHVNKSLVPLQPSNAPSAQERALSPKSPHFVRDLPSEVSVYFGDLIQLTFEAIGSGPMSYQWCKGTEVLGCPVTEPILQIPTAHPDHSGIYRCTVMNAHGETKTRECKVKVKFRDCLDSQVVPQITKQPMDLEVCISNQATFETEAVGSAGIYYQWMHEGRDIPGECGARLEFPVTSVAQAGTYVCRIHNDLKQHVITKQVSLKLQPTPKDVPYTATDKVALILGQSSYRSNNKELPAVKNDMYDIYDTLTFLGFKTFSFLDNSLTEMNKAIDLVCNLMQGKGNNNLYVVLYFLGHGFQFNGCHYLMPHDAMEGTQVSRCLCTEDVERRIVRDLNPIFVFMGHDLCRRKITSVIPEQLPAHLQWPLCKKRVMFFAASDDEEALEETNVPDREPTEANAASSQKERVTVHAVRGIFTRHLMAVLRKEPRTKMSNIYELFSETFKRPDPLIHKREMTPEFVINLPEYNRTLGDGILCEGQEKQFADRMEKWQKVNYLPRSRVLSMMDNVWLLHITFHQRGSNILEMRISEVDLRPRTASIAEMTVECYIVKETIPNYLCQFEEYPTNEPNTKSYMFFNIQRLQSRLQFQVRQIIYHSSEHHPEPIIVAKNDVTLDLEFPLVWNMWSSQQSEDFLDGERSRPGPCEQSEEALSSIESSC